MSPKTIFLLPIEVLARATSVKDSLDHLKSGTFLWKLRDKGVRGLKLYRRRYRLNIADLIITYTPNKGLQKNSCVGNTNSKYLGAANLRRSEILPKQKFAKVDQLTERKFAEVIV